MSFTNGKAFTVTAEDLKKPWGGRKDGQRFRCYLCLQRFVEGDVARWVYNNGAGSPGGNYGNFFTCAACDGKDVQARFKALMDPFWERYKALGFNDRHFE